MTTQDLPSDTLQLIRSALAEDLPAKEELFRRYLPRVRQIVALRMGRRLRRLAEQEDVVQTALLSAWRSLDSYQPRSHSDFTSWMATIVENTLRGLARHHGAARRDVARCTPLSVVQDSLSSFVLRGELTTPSEAAVGHEFEQQLEDAMLTLSETDREAIVLSRLCDMPADEMAEHMGLGSASSARARIARALTRLSTRLAAAS